MFHCIDFRKHWIALCYSSKIPQIVNANRLQISEGGQSRRLNVQNWASELSGRRLLLTSHSGYRLVLSFMTKVLNNTPFKKVRDMGQNQQLISWSCIVFLMAKSRICVKRNYLVEKKGAGKKMTTLAGDIIWEVGEHHRDQRTAWR